MAPESTAVLQKVVATVLRRFIAAGHHKFTLHTVQTFLSLPQRLYKGEETDARHREFALRTLTRNGLASVQKLRDEQGVVCREFHLTDAGRALLAPPAAAPRPHE